MVMHALDEEHLEERERKRKKEAPRVITVKGLITSLCREIPR